MMLRRRAGGLPDIRRDDEEEYREGVDEGRELGEERVREHEDNGGGGGGSVGEGQRDREHENNGRGGGENGQTEQLENHDHLVAEESDQSLEMSLNGMDNELPGGDVTNESNDSRTERLAARDITDDEEDVALINSIGEENVHASIRHMTELMEEEEEEEVPLIIAEEEEEEENASIEGVDGNREEANPIVSQSMASNEDGTFAAITLTESCEENEEEELTALS